MLTSQGARLRNVAEMKPSENARGKRLHHHRRVYLPCIIGAAAGALAARVIICHGQ